MSPPPSAGSMRSPRTGPRPYAVWAVVLVASGAAGDTGDRVNVQFAATVRADDAGSRREIAKQ